MRHSFIADAIMPAAWQQAALISEMATNDTKYGINKDTNLAPICSSLLNNYFYFKSRKWHDVPKVELVKPFADLSESVFLNRISFSKKILETNEISGS